MKKEYHRPRLHPPRKEFDFKPNKDQLIMGAFLDLGKPVVKQNHFVEAQKIANMWGEEI